MIIMKTTAICPTTVAFMFIVKNPFVHPAYHQFTVNCLLVNVDYHELPPFQFNTVLMNTIILVIESLYTFQLLLSRLDIKSEIKPKTNKL